ncbi:hypothetical protein CJO80_26805 (plasmid) [Ralstonia solanacearum]|nr:hypothetical protein CJO80_26805 [Ralstonia solanacearum]
MLVLRLLGRNCPAPSPSRRSASRPGSLTAAGRKRARHAQPLTARTPWYGQGDRQDRPSTVTASHGGTHARRSRMLKRTTCERPRLARDAGRRPRGRCTNT